MARSSAVLASLLLSLGIALVLPQLRLWEYDVFVSFCGDDTCTSFTSRFLAALDRKRIVVFRDDINLPRGGEIGPERLKAIETSRTAVVVFSKNYGTSDWCLDELVKIMECKRVLNQTVLPVFYNVSRSEVLEQKGIFAEALLKGPKDKVNNWRAALTEATDLAGLQLQNYSREPEFIEETVENIWKILEEDSATAPSRRQFDVSGQHVGTAGVISAYFFRHMTSGYSLNVSDPIEGQPVQLSYYLCVFGCGLVFWLLELLWAKLHDSGDRQADIRKVATLAKLIAPITTLNLCGCLLAPFMKLPLLVRFLVLFQVSSNPALLLIWAFLSLKECMILLDMHTPQKSSPGLRDVFSIPSNPIPHGRSSIPILKLPYNSEFSAIRSKVDEAGGSGSGHGSGANGREENRGRYGGNDGGGGAGGGGDRGESGSGHGSGASGSGENSDGCGGHGRDQGGTGSGHGSGAGGSGENRGRSEGGDRGRDRGGGDPESGGRETNTEQAFKSSKITEMSLMLTAQTTAALIGFHLTTPSSSSKALLVVVLIDQLVAYLCGLTSILLSSNKPEDSKAAKIFADIGFVCTALGFILMVAMFVPWYLVLIAVLLFSVVWLIFFRNGLKTRATEVFNYLRNGLKTCATEVFNYLKNSTQNL